MIIGWRRFTCGWNSVDGVNFISFYYLAADSNCVSAKRPLDRLVFECSRDDFWETLTPPTSRHRKLVTFTRSDLKRWTLHVENICGPTAVMHAPLANTTLFLPLFSACKWQRRGGRGHTGWLLLAASDQVFVFSCLCFVGWTWTDGLKDWTNHNPPYCLWESLPVWGFGLDHEDCRDQQKHSLGSKGRSAFVKWKCCNTSVLSITYRFWTCCSLMRSS